MSVFRLVGLSILLHTVTLYPVVLSATIDSGFNSGEEESDTDNERVRDPVAVVGVALGLALILVGGIVSIQLRYSPCRRLSKSGRRRFEKINDYYERNENNFYSDFKYHDIDQRLGEEEEEMQKLFLHEHPDKLDNPYIYAHDNAKLL